MFAVSDPLENDFLHTKPNTKRSLRSGTNLGSPHCRFTLPKRKESFPERRNCIICWLGCSLRHHLSRVSSFFTNFLLHETEIINDNNFQWNGSEYQQGSSALGLQANLYGSWNLNCRTSLLQASKNRREVVNIKCKISNQEERTKFQLSWTFAIKNLYSWFISAFPQFILLLSTRNSYYFAIKSSSLIIDLLKVHIVRKKESLRDSSLEVFLVIGYVASELAWKLVWYKLTDVFQLQQSSIDN